MKKNIVLVCLLGLLSVVAKGQQTGLVVFLEDERISQLVKTHTEQNKINKTTSGYRIQVFSGTSREEATKIQYDMQAMYPSLKAYIGFQTPLYRVRVGDFRNRYEAHRTLKEVAIYKPEANVFPDAVFIQTIK